MANPHVNEHSHDLAPGVLGNARSALTGTWLKRKFQFYRAIHQEYPSTGIWNFGDSPLTENGRTGTYFRYLLWESSACFYRSEFPGWSMPLLLWAGGTYARRPEDFPQEQSSKAWLEEYLLPLDLKAPGFRWHESVEKLAKTWSSARWHGKAPHPHAIKEPFPYASPSMRKYCRLSYTDATCRHIYTDANNVSRKDPWRNF